MDKFKFNGVNECQSQLFSFHISEEMGKLHATRPSLAAGRHSLGDLTDQ